ncbi:MAG: esterase family protein [Alistipes sp.]|nr:esterase family protein [Alistipes sp.]
MKRFLLTITLACISLAAAAQNTQLMQDMMRNQSRTEEKSIHSEILNADRAYTVYLPTGYEANTDKQYPVLYLLHGMSGNHKDWADRGHLKDVMDQLCASGEACDMIIISPNAGGNIYEGAWNGYFNMEGWAYERFFFEEFLPTVEKEYRIKGDKANRAIAGLSMGGGGSTSYAQRHADMFCACYAMSALMHLPAAKQDKPNDNREKLWYLTKAANEFSCVDYVTNADDKTKAELRTVAWYVDCGDDDFLFECNINFALAMRKAGVPYQLRVRDGGHTWEYWHSALYDALPFISRIFRNAK